ncbi:MAG TPA: 3'-5' exonuclease [Epsilonproteobacteria bacterium]|nr:3'-5' exonuclease [Campylobacterota bacterium]
MRKVFDELTKAFRRHKGVIPAATYNTIVQKHTTLFEESETIFFFLQASGYPIEYSDGYYRFKPFFTHFKEQRYCVVDIETNGSNPKTSQVIEIGAVMVENNEIVSRFETFVECPFLPEYITKITGIEACDLRGAPSKKEAFVALREFMQDAIFVAHNVSFDHMFLSASFDQVGLGSIGNPKLCTINLARRTFESERYGLAYLIESLGITTATHHRAYSDALCAAQVMHKSFETLPSNVKSADDLLLFATSSKKQRAQKKEQKSSTHHDKTAAQGK